MYESIIDSVENLLASTYQGFNKFVKELLESFIEKYSAYELDEHMYYEKSDW